MVWAIGIFSPVWSAAMAEENDVAFLDDVLFAFEAHLSLFARRREASRRQEIIPADYFGANEAALYVGVNCAGCFLRVHAALDRPGAHLGLARGEKRSQAHQVIRRLNQAIESRGLEAVRREHFSAFGRLKLGQLRFDAPADGDNGGVGTVHKFCKIVALDSGIEFSDFAVPEIQ